MSKFKIGHVYKVKSQALNDKTFYYCTIIANVNAGKRLPNGVGFYNDEKLHTYIPNMWSRPLNNYGCNLKNRLEYVGSYNECGNLLFNQNMRNHWNKHNTKLVYIPNLNPFLGSDIFRLPTL